MNAEQQAFDDFVAANFPAASPRDRQQYRRIWNGAMEFAEPKRAKAREKQQAETRAGEDKPQVARQGPRLDWTEDELNDMNKKELVALSKQLNDPASTRWPKDAMVEHILAVCEELADA